MYRALTTADLNQDGWDDLVIGAPGCSSLGHIQVGCVYILYGNESGLPSMDMDLDKDAAVLLKGLEVIVFLLLYMKVNEYSHTC